MSRYRKVDPKIWNDSKFMSLNDRGKLAFFFLLTHPHMTALGAMRASIPGLASEIGWSEKAFKEVFREALLKGMVKHDEKSSFLWLPNFLKYNRPESPNVVKAWKSSLDFLPECAMKTELIERVKAYVEALPEAFLEALPEAFLEALPEAFDKPMPYQEQEQEQNINIKKKFLDFVLLSEPEYQKLIDRYGKEGADERIEKLNIYIGKRGETKFYRKYSSCYHCILDWYSDKKQHKSNDDKESSDTSLDAAGRKLSYV